MSRTCIVDGEIRYRCDRCDAWHSKVWLVGDHLLCCECALEWGPEQLFARCCLNRQIAIYLREQARSLRNRYP